MTIRAKDKMATSTKASDEQPIRANSTEQQSPKLDKTETVSNKDEENNGASEDIDDIELGNDADIWKAEKAGEGYFVPVLIWCASVIFPLCAGSFGPMSSAFGICAVTESWRVENVTMAADNMLVGTDVENPKWLVALNGLSLALSLIANISLLLSMLNRLPFTLSQLVTITSFFSSSIISIVIITLASHDSFLSPGSSLSAPFYFGCISAGLSLLLSILLIFTFYFAKIRHEIPPDLSETLTLPQRTLMAQSLGFIIYLIGGAAIFSHIEGWKFTDGVYWVTVTLLTIGFGDIAPVTHTGRSLIIPYATTGIVMIGLVIGSIGTLVLDRGAKKMFARMTVNARAKKLQVASREEHPDAPTSVQPQLIHTTSHKNEHLHHVHLANERAEFDLMREVQADASRSQQQRLFIISIVAIFMLWLLGALVFWSTEKASQSWSYFDGLYFCFISLLTIGYGDFEVSSPAGKAAFVFWAFLAVPTMTILVASMGATFLMAVKAVIHRIDAFVVLPHEGGHKDSYLNKMHKMAKLKAKAKFGHRLGWAKHKDGMERHLHPEHGEGVRNPDTGVVHHDHRKIHQKLPHDEQISHNDLLYQLAREIRELLPKLSASKRRKYTYEEWTKYIHLLNHDASKKDHISTASWSWLDDSSPLFRGKNETQWILERLSVRLEEELKKDTNGRDEGKGITEGED